MSVSLVKNIAVQRERWMRAEMQLEALKSQVRLASERNQRAYSNYMSAREADYNFFLSMQLD